MDVLRMRLLRAFRLLGLHVLADLEDFIKIERRLLRLEGEGRGEFRRRTLAYAFQAALKQFSKYLAGRRETPVDHLAPWPRLKMEERTQKRRALTPEEMARALVASDCLDELCGRASPMRPVWTALLVATPRISALAALDVVDLDRDESRLLLKGNGNKRAGAGAIDEKTLAELVEYVGDRSEGPLFLSPTGTRIEKCRSLDQWRAAVSLAAVDLEWPEGVPSDLRSAYLTHYALMSGRVRVAMGGPLSGPHRPGLSKRSARERARSRIAEIADAIRPAWQERMRGVDQHCLRMTHRTWALLEGVPEILIDRQLGHTSRAGDAALHAVWSAVGRANYTDMDFFTLDARRSAAAVRGILDRAAVEFRDVVARGESTLRAPEVKMHPGFASTA
jgi:site-specific recombinase XerC